MAKGRPKKSDYKAHENEFVRTVRYNDGTIGTWTYNLDKNPFGPIKTEFEYPKNYKTTEMENMDLPKTRKTYYNEENGKWISFSRAKQLGIID